MDRDYFAELADFGHRYGYQRIYAYFNAVYCQTDRVRRYSVFELIAEQGQTLHEEDYLAYCKLMVTLYYAMLAEENREPAHRYPLKKRVKKIGVFQVLIEGMRPEDAAVFSKGVPAHELRKLVADFERREAELGL